MELPEIGAAIKDRRETLRLSMRACATAAAISPQTWADLEHGKHPPGHRTQRGVAAALGWPIDWWDKLGHAEWVSTDIPAVIQPVVTLAELHARVEELAELVAEMSDRMTEMDVKLRSDQDRRATRTAQGSA